MYRSFIDSYFLELKQLYMVHNKNFTVLLQLYYDVTAMKYVLLFSFKMREAVYFVLIYIFGNYCAIKNLLKRVYSVIK